MIRSTPLIGVFLLAIALSGHAQRLQSRPTDFVIKQISYHIWNDTMLMSLLFDFEVDDEGVMISGRGGLSLCGCYCDSIWDAWPSEVGNGIQRAVQVEE